jgi:hypothetical protein
MKNFRDRYRDMARTLGFDGPSAMFYRGIPASEVVRAIDELKFAGLAWLDRRA